MNNLSILLSVLLVGASPAFAADTPQLQEGDRWEFKATYKEGITSTSDILDGNYEIVFQQGRLEVFYISEGQKIQASAGNAESLKRLIPFNQDDLRFMDFPLSPEKNCPWSTAMCKQVDVAPSSDRPLFKLENWSELRLLRANSKP